MSVYIKGIDVPKEGTVIVIDSTGQVWSNEWPTRGYTRIDGAKAVPVPEHGELIEREPILDVMRKERDRISETYGPNDEYVNCLNKYAISMVTSAKTIIPASGGKEYERQ